MFVNALRRSIRQGQDAGTYLVVDTGIANQWNVKRISPFGCVEKKDCDPRYEARVVHDLSFPAGASTNNSTIPELLSSLTYTRVYALAHRIECLHRRHPGSIIKILKGDVQGEYRHIPVSADIAGWFVGILQHENALVIDLSLPFRWSGSSSHYGAFGNAISHIISRESPHSLDPSSSDNDLFFAYEWVDDHLLIEADHEDRLELCERALRLAMLAVLGPNSINESKFSSWSSRLIAFGLEWDTTNSTVSMPTAKLAKAANRVTEMLKIPATTKHMLAKLLGSLRRVSICIPSARPFFQQLVTLWRGDPHYRRIHLTEGARRDLRWFQFTLEHGKLQGIPTSMFGTLPTPVAHFYMDASNEGLCVLHPPTHQYLRLRFDSHDQTLIDEDHLSINAREQLSVALLLAVWGSSLSDNAFISPFAAGLTTPPPYHGVTNAAASTRLLKKLIESLALLRHDSLSTSRLLIYLEGKMFWRISDQGRGLKRKNFTGLTSLMDGLNRSRVASQDLQSCLLNLQLRSLADSSRRRYASPWQQWCQFCTDQGFNFWLPQDDRHAKSLQLVLFATYAWRRHNNGHHLQYTTVRSKLSHVAWYHRVYRGYRPTLTDGQELALIGMRRAAPAPTRQRAAVTTQLLRTLFNQVNQSSAQHRLIYGAAVLGFFFLMRSAEYLEIDDAHHRYYLRVSGVTVLDAHGPPTNKYTSASSVRIHFRASKNAQHGHGRTRIMAKATENSVCPVFAAMLLLKHAKQINLQPLQPLCTLTHTRTITAKMMNRSLQSAAQSIGFNSASFSTHSLRIGGATALFGAGVDEKMIKMQGRWRSNAYEIYTRYPISIAIALTNQMTS